MVHGIPQNEHSVDGRLAYLAACTNDCSVVVLDELQQLLLLWIWDKMGQPILERDNHEIFSAKVQDVLLALLQFPCTFLELLWGQYFLLASLLDCGKFLYLVGFPHLL
jgi:hypothetical protein